MLDITQVLQNIIEKKLLDFENEFKMDQTKKFVVDTLWLSHMNVSWHFFLMKKANINKK